MLYESLTEEDRKCQDSVQLNMFRLLVFVFRFDASTREKLFDFNKDLLRRIAARMIERKQVAKAFVNKEI